jgi:ABC-2 type transport system ATP-binding protein
MEDEVVIKVENVYKDFILPHERTGTVKGAFTTMFSRATKKKEIQHALKDISFKVNKGEFFGIVGRNGSGKSTLLKILANIYQPTKGNIVTKGKLVPFIELGVGFNAELTGRDNVYLNGAVLGFSTKEVEAMYEDIVGFAELERFMDQKLKNYSSGMQVRLAFSMAVRANADILLIDEVLAVGDADFQRKCFKYFKTLKHNKKTVVFVSHDMSAIREYCDRAMLIEDNMAIDIGPTDKIAQKYMRLFMVDNVSQNDKEQSEDRWGDQAIRIDNVKAQIKDNLIDIKVKIKCNQDFQHPVVGFRIRNAAGLEVTGTNTKQEKRVLPDLTKGEFLTVGWQLPNILSDGEYSIDVALQYADEITVADWWDGATTLIVNKERHLPYSIDPGFKTIID